jgi:hypothetical protein
LNIFPCCKVHLAAGKNIHASFYRFSHNFSRFFPTFVFLTNTMIFNSHNMRHAFLFSLLFSCVFAFAQTGNISVYSNKGLKFTVVLNGIDQNDQPATHVKVTDVPEGSYRIKVRFENEKLGQASRGMFVEPSKEYRMAVMHKSVATVDQHFDGVHNQMVKTLGNDPNAKANNYDVMENYVIRYVSESTANSNSSSDEKVVAFRARTKFSNPANEISEGGAGGFSTSSSKGPVKVAGGEVAPPPSDTKVSRQEQVVDLKSNAAVTSSYSSACTSPMDENTFSATKSGVASQPSSDLRTQVAKQIINAVCMSVEQISAVAGLIQGDEGRMDFVKYGYDYCFDPQNYASLANVFETPESVEAFNQFLAAKK